jgi:hypothetical protein
MAKAEMEKLFRKTVQIGGVEKFVLRIRGQRVREDAVTKRERAVGSE